MAAISRREQGGRIYNNTRARVLLRRKCVKPADLTTHSPPKTVAPPRSDTPFPSIFSLPSRALPPAHAAQTHARRLRHAFLADPTTHSPSKTFARPRTTTRPPRAFSHSLPAHFHSSSQRRCTPAGCTMHARRPHNTFPTEDLLPSPHSDTPSPSTSARPRSPDAHPQAARYIPRRPHNTFPAESLLPPPHSDTPSPCPPATSPQPRRTPTSCATSPPQRRPASPSVPLRAQKNGTAQCMCDAECLGRPSLRSVIGVGEPRAVRRRCGALAWRVGLRPQPWALRSRRCGRVLRA